MRVQEKINLCAGHFLRQAAPSWCNLHHNVATSIKFLHPARFWKTAGGIVLDSVTVSAVSAVPAASAVSADVLPYISVAIKASFLKLGMCNICKNNIAEMFLGFFLI